MQILQNNFYRALAFNQYEISQKLLAARGEIFIQDTRAKKKGQNYVLYPFAINHQLTLVYANPSEIKDINKTTKVLSPILEITQEYLKTKLSRPNDLYEPLKHRVDDETIKQIKELVSQHHLSGIGFLNENFRYYPEKNIGAHLVGFLNFDNNDQKGQYGIEEYFDKELRGKTGYLRSEKDPLGYLIALGTESVILPQDGSKLILSIDRTIQFTACTKLAQAIKKHGADGGTVIIMEPKIGAMIAMCSYPDFDPNQYNQVKKIQLFNNPAIFYQYEPGSVFKVITMAAALEAGKIDPQTSYLDKGLVKIGGYTIQNAQNKVYGKKTMTQVLEDSINTGAVFVSKLLGPSLFQEYVKDFGFGEPTGIELEKEVSGNIKSLEQKKEIYSATASFGQGISVTPLQLLGAYGAVANGGKLMKPYLVDEIIKANGQKTKTAPKVLRQVISPRAAAQLGGMLVSVVENGHGKRAGVEGYYVAGKTGTAQVPLKEKRGYESNLTVGTFVGFAPVDNPVFVMLVKIDHPRDVEWAESSAAPLFGELAKFLLNYYEIPPEREIKN